MRSASLSQEVDQFFSRESRFPQQRHQCSLRQVAIVLKHYRSPSGSGIIENEMAARGVIQDEAIALEKANDLPRPNGGELRHTPSRAMLRECCRR